jgi:5-methyltetrahydropteroyltriglutamate--homocysteine methyltransferase
MARWRASGFIPYVNERLGGIELRRGVGRGSNWAQSPEYLAFPEYYQWAAQMPGAVGKTPPTQWVCTGLISYRGHEALRRDIANLHAAIAAAPVEEAFMPAVSRPALPIGTPTSTPIPRRSSALPSPTRCMRNTRAIVDAGFILQIDDPQLASHWAMHPEIDVPQCRK